jgi:hypothetical protein
MILERGNMWDAFGKGVFMITTNPIIRKDGAVVMGRGIALEAKTRFPRLPYDFGEMLKMYPNNIGYIGEYDHTRIYWFMVKDHWANQASLDIIQNSVSTLDHLFGYTDERVDLNFPGIGNGGLKREDVLPLLEKLPDNIHIWEKPIAS